MKKLSISVVILVTALAAIALVLYVKRPIFVIPRDIQKQVNFGIFYPQPNKQTSIQKTTFKYDPKLKQVSFIANFNGQQVTFSEQSSPDSFADDPNFYPKFVEKLNGYATFDSINGRVDLTRPKDIKGQAAVVNSKGTLLFANSSEDISEDSWKLLFNSMLFTKPS